MILALNKPYGVLSQFTPERGSQWRTLSEFGLPKEVYPIGRLDADSEGLLLLSDERIWVDRLLNPSRQHPREYWAQVEGVPSADALANLRQGVTIGGYKTLPCRACTIDPAPQVAPRVPPIRERKSIPTTWISLELIEGKNRQVRRMTAAVGCPTLRLIRVRIGQLRLDSLRMEPGMWQKLDLERIQLLAP